MKNLLLTVCVAGALMGASGAASQAADLSRLAGLFGSPPTPCESSCRTQANACRDQCAHPEDADQCIVNCSSSECRASCDDFEKSCDRHCEGSKGG
jgi:hypothetical protein